MNTINNTEFLRLFDCDGASILLKADKQLTNGDIFRIKEVIINVKFPNGKIREDEWQFDEIVNEIVEKCRAELNIDFIILPFSEIINIEI